MIVKNKKLRFLGFFLSLTIVFGIISAYSLVPEETSADDGYSETTEPETTVSDPIIDEVDILSPDDSDTIQSTMATTTTAYEEVTFPDGIYALRLVANDARWMDIQNSSTTAGAPVQQDFFEGTSPADNGNDRGLFRFTRVGTTNRYIIRLMLNENLTFTYDNSDNVITKLISSNDANVAISDTFTVTVRAGGIMIKKYGTSKYITSQNADASGSESDSASHLVASSSAGASSIWFLDGYDTPIEDGVYCFKNSSNSLWMDTWGDSRIPGKHIQQCSYSSVPAESFSRGALFKISKIYDTTNDMYRYIIRSMLDNTLSFKAYGNEVITYKIADVDAQVPASSTFRIRYYGNSFIIQPHGTSVVVASDGSNSSGAAGAPGSRLRPVAKPNSNLTTTMWKAYKYTGAERSGVYTDFPSSWHSEGFIVGDSGTLSVDTWSTIINANKPHLDILPEYESLVTYTYDSSACAMTLQAEKAGRMRVDISIRRGNSSFSEYTNNVQFYIVPQEGTYYIQNAETERYIDIEGPSTSEGACIQEWSFHTSSYEKWIVEHVENSDGYIRLKSAYSNKYIGVDSANTSLIKQYAAQNNYTLWRIDRTTTGNLKFQSKISEDTNKVLAVPTISTIRGTNLEQITYTSDMSYNDEWTLHITKELSLIAVPETYDRSTYFPNILDYMDDIGYDDAYSNHVDAPGTIEAVGSDELLERMKYSKILLVRTHGSPIVIQTSDADITRSYLLSVPETTLEYSELIIYGACKTALGGADADNLVSATVSAGARTVIGFQDSVVFDACNLWCEKFFEYYAMYYSDESKTISDVCESTYAYLEDYVYTSASHIVHLASIQNHVVAGEDNFP